MDLTDQTCGNLSELKTAAFISFYSVPNKKEIKIRIEGMRKEYGCSA